MNEKNWQVSSNPFVGFLSFLLVTVTLVLTVFVTIPTNNFIFHLPLLHVFTARRKNTYALPLDEKLSPFLGILELYSCSKGDMSAYQVRSLFVSNADRDIPYGDCIPFAKDSVHVVSRRPSPIGAFINESCRSHNCHLKTYLSINWPPYFIQANVSCKVASCIVIAALYCSCRNFQICCGTF